MKRITYLFLFLCLQIGYSVNAYAEEQVKHITMELKNVSMDEALKEIEKASGYSFFYDENTINLSERISVTAENKSLEKVLTEILQSTDITFEISNNQIVLLPAGQRTTDKNFIIIDKASPQQEKKRITGTVVDAYGESIIGANVVEKGTTNGTITDINGRFTLTVAENAALIVSYIGYLAQEVRATDELLSISLKEDTQTLDEIVVTGFGLSQKKATLTGAIASVGADEISRSVATTASGALVGKLAGINTRQTDGRPGATTSLQIRNMGNPLYVIDGIQSDAG